MNSQTQTHIEHRLLDPRALPPEPSEGPAQALLSAAHDFLVQVGRPDLLSLDAQERALCALDFP